MCWKKYCEDGCVNGQSDEIRKRIVSSRCGVQVGISR